MVEDQKVVSVEDLADAAVSVRGIESDKQLQTAKNHFNRFLELHDDQRIKKRTCDTIVFREVTAELLGRFGTYLFSQLKKPSGALAYMSQVKTFFATKWSRERRWELHHSVCGDDWYKKIRDGMNKMFVDRAIAEGQAIVDQAPPMFRDSLRQIATTLFGENTAAACRDRDLLVTQWHCMGRASETGLRHSAVRFIGKPTNAIQLCVGRTKTNKLQYVHAFCDSESWEADIFHSKACHLISTPNVDEAYHFPSASANVLNRILERAAAQASIKFQSHSSRRGSASEALAHGGVAVSEVIARGGWSFDSISRVFMYFSGMDRGDMRVGRVIAGWRDSDNGGKPPSPDCLPVSDQATFRALTTHVFRHVLGKYDDMLLSALAASVVMHFNSVEKHWNAQHREDQCLVHKLLSQSLVAVGGAVSSLPEWSAALHHNWLIANLPWLSRERLDELPEDERRSNTVSIFTFQETLQHLVVGQHEVSKMLVTLNNTITLQQAQLEALNNRVASLSGDNARLLSAVSTIQSSSVSHMAQMFRPPPLVPALAPASIPARSHVPQQQSALPSSLKGMRSSHVFMEYFANRWYALPLLSKEKELMRKIKLIVARVLDFLPPDCTLTLPPRPGDASYSAWHISLEQHARAAETQMITYLARIKPNITKRERAVLLANNAIKDLANTNERTDYPKPVFVNATGMVFQ